MLMGTLLYGVKYTIPEYICSFLVAGGVSAFALSKVRIPFSSVYEDLKLMEGNVCTILVQKHLAVPHHIMTYPISTFGITYYLFSI